MFISVKKSYRQTRSSILARFEYKTYYVTWLASCVAQSVCLFSRTSEAGGELKEKKERDDFKCDPTGELKITLQQNRLEKYLLNLLFHIQQKDDLPIGPVLP